MRLLPQYLLRDVFVLISIIVTFVSIANGQVRQLSPEQAANCIALLSFCYGGWRGACAMEPRGCSCCSVGFLLAVGLPLISLLNLIAPLANGLVQLSVLAAPFLPLLITAIAIYVVGFGIGSIFAPSK